MPEFTFEAEAGVGGLVGVGEDPGLGSTVAPAEAGECAEGVGDFLIEVDAETEFITVCAGGGDVGGPDGAVDGFLVTAHVGAVEIRKEADGTRVVGVGEAVFELGDHAPGVEVIFVHVDAVGEFGQLEKTVAGGPLGLVEFGGESGGVAERVAGKIPGFVGHECPAHKLCARIVGVGIVVEDVLEADLADGERDVGDVLLAREVERVIGDLLLVATEADSLTEEKAGEIDVGHAGTDAECFAVGKTFDAYCGAQAGSLPDERVRMEFRAVPGSKTGHDVEGNGFVDFAVVIEAVGAGVVGGKGGIILDDVGVLGVPVAELVGGGVAEGRGIRELLGIFDTRRFGGLGGGLRGEREGEARKGERGERCRCLEVVSGFHERSTMPGVNSSRRGTTLRSSLFRYGYIPYIYYYGK